MSENTINLIVRILPSGEELDVELPLYTTVKEIIDELLNEGMVPRTNPQGDPYTYEMALKGSQTQVMQEKTLFDIGIKNGDTMLLMPRLVAGFC